MLSWEADTAGVSAGEADVIDFPEGIPGFSGLRRFSLLDIGEGPFKWLRSIEDPSVGLVVMDPREFRPDYVAYVPARELDVIDVRRPDEADVYVVVVVTPDPRRMTANLKAPIVVNRTRRLAKQVVLLDGRFGLRHKVIEEIESCLSTGGND